MNSKETEWHWPALEPPYALALREAVDYIEARYAPVGIIAAGSILRGQADPASDLDIYTVHLEPMRQRIQRFFNGVPAEIFVNPPAQIRAYFREEHGEGRPSTAHMLSTGFVVLARDPIVGELQKEAKEWLACEYTLTEKEQTVNRYFLATLVEDAIDVAASDTATAQMLMARAVERMARFAFQKSNQSVPRDKELLSRLAQLDRSAGDMATAFFTDVSFADRKQHFIALADHVLGVRGFFEWESDAQPVELKEEPSPRLGSQRGGQ